MECHQHAWDGSVRRMEGKKEKGVSRCSVIITGSEEVQKDARKKCQDHILNFATSTIAFARLNLK